MAHGEPGVLTMNLLFRQFYVFLCSLLEHTTKKHIGLYEANMPYQGLRDLCISKINYAPSVAKPRSEQSRL